MDAGVTARNNFVKKRVPRFFPIFFRALVKLKKQLLVDQKIINANILKFEFLGKETEVKPEIIDEEVETKYSFGPVLGR